MFGFLFLSLLVTTLVVGGALLAMFVDVAFAGPKLGLQYAPALRGGRPGVGFGMFNGAELALRVERGVSQAVTSLGMKPAAAASCDAACHEREIRVTTPEVLAIVEELRERQSPAQIDAIRKQAQQTLQSHDGAHHCPLLISGSFCACDVARPVACRTHCVAGADSPAEAVALAKSVGVSMTELFRDCLRSSGLDDSRYELNSALVQALKTPQAARRWARGEQIIKSDATTTHA